MKHHRRGKAAVFSSEQEEQLFSALATTRDKCLFAICLYTGCRINECVKLSLDDIVGDCQYIIFPKEITKGRRDVRSVPISPKLKPLLFQWLEQRNRDRRYPSNRALFPGRHGLGYLSTDAADVVLRKTCQTIGLIGISTHSFRRTALTRMAECGIPLNVIQNISGHRSLSQLQKYLEATPQQIEDAVSVI